MNILILGGNFRGKGPEAMLLTLRSELGKRIPGSRFYAPVLSWEAQHAAAEGLEPLGREWRRTSKIGKLLRLLGNCACKPRVIPYVLRGQWGVAFLLHVLRDIDAVLNIAGYAYGDVWGWRMAQQASMYVDYCARTGRRYVFMPQAWGPLHGSKLRRHVKRMCEQATAFYARDKQSQDFLAELLGVEREAIRLSDDIAFQFAAARPETGLKLLRESGLTSENKPIVGVFPNVRVYERAPGKGPGNRYVKSLVRVCEKCRALGAEVMLIPHEMNEGGVTDAFLCRTIAQLAGDECIHALTDYRSAAAIKAAIGQFALSVSSRFHAAVASLSQGVPTVAIGWSHKYEELMGRVGLRDFVIGHEELNPDASADLVAEAFSRREEMRSMLHETLPAIEQRVGKTFDEVAGMLK